MDMSIVNRQWSSRPNDERYTSLIDMDEFMKKTYYASQSKIVDLKSLSAIPMEDDEFGLQIVGPSGKPANITNWAFKQLSTSIGSSPSFVSRMPGKLASEVTNWAIQNSEDEKKQLLVTKSDHEVPSLNIRALTGEKYGRIWNHQITTPLVNRFGDGISGESGFKAPGEFGKDVVITKENTTFYGSEQDMFVCLVDEKNRIEIPNRRNGEKGSLARGFIISNSETGSGAVKFYFFLFDYMCSNRNIWGLGESKEFTLRHTLNAPEKWFSEIEPELLKVTNSKASLYETKLIEAQNMKVPEVDKFLHDKLVLPSVTDKMIKAINAAHREEEGRPMETLWDVVTGVTAFAKSIPFQNERILIERAAGKLMALAD